MIRTSPFHERTSAANETGLWTHWVGYLAAAKYQISEKFEYFAIRNRCPHQGAPLCEGKLWGALKSDVPGSFEYNETKDILACIQHGWEFSVRTGQSWCDPARR